MKENKDFKQPEKDLMVGDVFRMMCKIIFSFVLVWLITVGTFLGYVIYKDYQFTNSVNQMMDKYNEFINSFEFVGEEYFQDGNGNNIIGDNNTAYGADTEKKNSQEEEWESEIHP